MYVVCVTVKVKAGQEESFLAATLENARGTRQESGNLRFDVLRGEENASQFFFYEVYKTKDDFTAHQRTAHYRAWKDKVTDWMAEPRQGVKHFSIYPEQPSDW